MKKYLLIVFLISVLFSSIQVLAQESVIEDVNYTQLETFIELAKTNYPKNKILQLHEQQAKNLAPLEMLTYLNMVSASYYYRPRDKRTIDIENPYSVNGFQVSVNASLGSLISTPYRVKQAKIEYEIAKLESADYEKILVNEVKSRYYEYILQLKQLKLSTQTAQDAKAIADDIAVRFQRGEVELALYNESKTAVNGAKAAKMQTEVDYLRARDQLEEIIGKKLSDVRLN